MGRKFALQYQLGFTFTWWNIREEFAVKVTIGKMSTEQEMVISGVKVTKEKKVAEQRVISECSEIISDGEWSGLHSCKPEIQIQIQIQTIQIQIQGLGDIRGQ